MKVTSSARTVLVAGATLAAVLCLLFWRALFEDRVLAPTDLIFTSAFFADLAPPGFSRPSNPLLYDQVYQFAPWRRFARQSLMAGHLPVWNPYSLAGSPFIGTQQTAIFYPLNLLLLAVPFERTFVWSAILRLWTAGILAFLLARRLGLSPLPGMIAALSFMLCGYLVVGVGHPHIGVAIWLPGITLAVELAVAARSRAAAIRATVLLGLLVGIQFSAGHIETSVDIFIATTLYGLIRWYQLGWARMPGRAAKLQPIVILVAGWIVGTGLGAMQLVPFLEWLPLSEEAANRAASTSFTLFDPAAFRNLLMLPLFIFPNLYNNPTWDPPYFNFLPWGRNFHSDMLYVGVVPFLLAILALVRCWRSTPVVRALGIVGLFALGRALYLPVFDWINHLPLLDLGKPHLFRLMASFSACMLAGFGAQTLLSDRATDVEHTRKLWRRLCIGVLALGLVVVALGRFLLPSKRESLTKLNVQVAREFNVSVGGEARPAESYEREARRMTDNTIAAFSLRNVRMYLPIAIGGVALLIGWVARRRAGSRVPGWALLALAAGDQMAFAWGYNPTISRKDFYPAPPILSAMASDTSLFRFSATRRDLAADAHMMFGLSDIRGIDFPTQWYATYAKLAPEHVAWRLITFDGFDSPLLRVLNVKYVFARQDRVPLSPDHVARVLPSGRGRLWQVRQPQPRSFMVYEARRVQTDSEAALVLREEPQAVFSRVLLAAESGDRPDTATGPADPGAEVSVVEYGPVRSVWRVKTDRPGYLFTGDAYYPGWKAELDGEPTRLYRANIAFRAVRVPAGEHLVVHRFQPRSVYLGLAVSGVSLTIMIILLLVARGEGGPGAATPMVKET